MSQKRQARDTTTSLNETGDNGKPKKRRVSLACDSCRAAREKCDGARPQCGTCIALARPCSYTPATKKRGVQTGYLRTIELSLAWIFDHVPESEQSLHQLLTQPTLGRDAHALLGKGSAGRHLQKVWNETRVRKAIDVLLVGTQGVPTDSSDNEHVASASDRPAFVRDEGHCSRSRPDTGVTTRTMPEVTDTAVSGRGFGAVLKLPSHWERLMAVYVSYAHCWLPIVHPEVLRSLAASYGTSGILVDLDGDRSEYSRHSELWSALAIASFQDASNPEYGYSSELLGASHIFRVARSLMPDDDETYDIHNISALILHSVIFIGRGRTFAASLLLGKAARLLRRLQLDCNHFRTSHLAGLDEGQLDMAGIACSFLDTLTSLSLSQRAVTEVCDTASKISPLTAEYSGFDQVWQSVPSSERPEQQQSQIDAHATMEPMRTLLQLHALAKFLSGTVYPPRLPIDRQTRAVCRESLVQTLDPRFSYCNSLISSGSIPMMPSAFLVKLLFLTATIESGSQSGSQSGSHLRPSLLSGFLGWVESCFANFGASRTPPVISLLFQMLQKYAVGDDMSEAEQNRWRSAVGTLYTIWQDGPSAAAAAAAAAEALRQQQGLPRRSFTPMQVGAAGEAFDAHTAHSGSSRSAPLGLDSLAGDRHAAQSRVGYQQQQTAVLNPNPNPNPGYGTHGTHGTHGTVPFATPLGLDRNDSQPVIAGGHRTHANFDYDALFEDMGSLHGYADAMETDTRFMTNLGFAPGCDLGEIFQDGCGG